MANTYYDSQLTAEEIEEVLEAISSILTPANNGKVLAISNGKIEVRSVQWGGGEAVLEPLSVTVNGDYYPGAGVDGFDEVHVAVPNSYTASDEGKVVNNGALVTQTARASQIIQNGTYDTTLNDEVTVNVSGGGSAVVQPLSVTQNGIYRPPSGVDGYAPVTVNVSGGGDNPFALTDYIESSGTQYIDTGYLPKSISKYEMVCNFANVNSYPIIFTCGGFIAVKWSYVGDARVYWGGNYINTGFSNFFGNKTLVKIKSGSYSFSMENWNTQGVINSFSLTDESSLTSTLFWNRGAATNYVTMKLYRFRIFENDTMVHEFIPWIDDNDVVCLKDTVTGDLKYNAGTGVFTYGSDLQS